jgi:thioredoxin 1
MVAPVHLGWAKIPCTFWNTGSHPLNFGQRYEKGLLGYIHINGSSYLWSKFLAMRDYFEELKAFIANNSLCIIYFYNNHCAPCRALRPKLEYMLANQHKGILMEQVDASIFIKVAVQFDVFAAPVMIIFADGREFRRYSKFISLEELDADLERLKMLIHE